MVVEDSTDNKSAKEDHSKEKLAIDVYCTEPVEACNLHELLLYIHLIHMAWVAVEYSLFVEERVLYAIVCRLIDHSEVEDDRVR